MKKLLLLTLFAVCIGIIMPNSLQATEISAGLTTWYARYVDSFDDEKIKFDPGFLLGPVLSIKLNNDFNLTFVFLYGKLDYTESDGIPGTFNYKENYKIKRTDADIALNYRLNDYFKFFGGIKYSVNKLTGLFKLDDPSDYLGLGGNQESSASDNIRGLGPGIGISTNYPIKDNLFFLANLSGLYLWFNAETKISGYPTENYDFKMYGFNSTLSLAYYIPQASTVISLGGRYQYLIDSDDSSSKSKFYGITLTATYAFNI
jgi:hypothetical protein